MAEGPAPRASILVTGDEVLGGRISEANAGPLAGELIAGGIDVVRTVIVGDDEALIATEVSAAIAGGLDLLVTTGGLGPTGDDLTMRAVATGAGLTLEQNPEARRTVAERTAWVALDDDVRERLLDAQALLPSGSGLIPAAGTAPGAMLRAGPTLVVVLPGPPWERAKMWAWATEQPPLADLLARGRPQPERVLRIFGTSESRFVQELDRLEVDVAAALGVGVCARDGELEVTLSGPVPAIDAAEAHLGTAFGERLYASDDTDLDGTIQRGLRGAGQTLAVAESCTGGGLGERITATPGASEVFIGGVIAYADEVKEAALGVPRALLATHGAVSSEVAERMASGVRETFGADWGLAVTGVAGPRGGTPEKPVGLVFLAVAGPSGAWSEEHHFRGDRERVRERSAAIALHLLRRALTS